MKLLQNFYSLNISTQNTNFKAESADLLASRLGEQVSLPDEKRNYTIFNQNLVNKLVNKKDGALPAILRVLSKSEDEKQIAEGLYVIDRMIDNNVKDAKKCYPVICRFNNTDSPTVQVLLAGIYRKTLPPDAFGPLMKMMIKDSQQTKTKQYFDASEEIGGALLEYFNTNPQKGCTVINELKSGNAQRLYQHCDSHKCNTLANV